MSLMLAGQIAVEGIFYSALGFVAIVSLFWPWWKSQLGWTVTAKSLVLAVAVFPSMLMYWFGGRTPGWAQYVAVYALWAIPPVLGWRAVVIWHAQRKARDII